MHPLLYTNNPIRCVLNQYVYRIMIINEKYTSERVTTPIYIGRKTHGIHVDA